MLLNFSFWFSLVTINIYFVLSLWWYNLTDFIHFKILNKDLFIINSVEYIKSVFKKDFIYKVFRRHKVVKMVYISRPGQFLLNLKKKFYILLLYQVNFFKILKKIKSWVAGSFLRILWYVNHFYHFVLPNFISTNL